MIGSAAISLLEAADDAVFRELNEIDGGVRFDMRANLDDLATIAAGDQQRTFGLTRIANRR